MRRALAWIPPDLARGPEADLLWNALASWAGAAIGLGSGVARFTSCAPPPLATRALDVRLEGEIGFLFVPIRFPFLELFGADLTVDDFAVLPDSLRRALGEGIVTTLAAALPAPWTGAVIRAEGLWSQLVPAPATSLRWFRITVEGLAPGAIVVDVGATREGLSAVFASSEEGLRAPGARAILPRVVWRNLADRLTRLVIVTLGRLDLKPAALSGLKPGSIVVLAADLDPAILTLRADDVLFRFSRDEKDWTCRAILPAAIRSHPNHETQMTDDHAHGLVPTTGGITIPIDLDIGQVAVALSDLATWQIGSVVSLDAAMPTEGLEVVLRTNGQVFGAGDLVRIDARLAVRITRLDLA